MSKVSWKAIYDDGTELPQYNEGGSENNYNSIERGKLAQFVLTVDGKPRIVVHLDENKRLIYRRRVAQAVFDSSKQQIVYFVGWQENKYGVNVQSISFLFEDGHVEVTDGFRKNHPWFYPIVFRGDELA